MSPQESQPPQPPSITPRLRMHKAELAGMLFLAAIPVAALLGAFGPTQAEASAEGEGVVVRVTYPSVMRHRTHQDLRIHVRNRSDRAIEQVEVTVDPEYLGAFNRILFSQAPGGSYSVTLERIAPGETRLVALELEADDYWRHRGTVRVTTDDRDVVADVSTFMLP